MNIKDRLTLQVKYIARVDWSTPSYAGYGYDNWARYIFKDSDGNIYTWKTTSCLSVFNWDEDGNENFLQTKEGDLITIKGTVKAFTTYNDTSQTELTRVKLISVDEVALTKEQLEEAKREEQLKTLKGKDFTWKIPYRQYKKHYSDCETLVGSYEDTDRGAFISIIVREGRLKASGVRGEHYSGYELTNELGLKRVYRAVSEENALKRANKESPDHEWKCTKIYDYRNHHRSY